MPYNDGSYIMGLLARRQQDVERRRQEQSTADLAGYEAIQRERQIAREDLDQETKRAELAAKYGELAGQTPQAAYGSELEIEQASEVGRLAGAAQQAQPRHPSPYGSEAIQYQERVHEMRGGLGEAGHEQRMDQIRLQNEGRLASARQRSSVTDLLKDPQAYVRQLNTEIDDIRLRLQNIERDTFGMMVDPTKKAEAERLKAELESKEIQRSQVTQHFGKRARRRMGGPSRPVTPQSTSEYVTDPVKALLGQ